MSAIMKTRILAARTAAAARSFTFPAFSLNSGETMSTKCSIAVFTISRLSTSPMQNRIITQSPAVILHIKPRIITVVVDKI